jgi:pyruvate,water dikinase
METDDRASDKLIAALRERAKELNCLYEVEKLLRRTDQSLAETFQAVAQVISAGWQYTDICEVAITCEGTEYKSSDFAPTPWVQIADIVVQEEIVGAVRVYYLEERPQEDEGPFLKEEARLIHSIAERLGHYIMFQKLYEVRRTLRRFRADADPGGNVQWSVAVDLLRDTDKNLFMRISRKMLNLLCSAGVAEAQTMLQDVDAQGSHGGSDGAESNIPEERRALDYSLLMSDAPFELAAQHLSDQEIMQRLQRWIQEDKVGFFVKVLGNPRASLPELADAIRRFQHGLADRTTLPISTLRSLRVTLAQRFLTEQLHFVKIAKEYVRIADYHDLIDRLIMPADSHGKLGGKGSGLLLATGILKAMASEKLPIGEVKTPKTWYVASDGILDFINHNDLQDVMEQKFKEIDEVRREYPNIVQLFKNSPFPPELVQGLSVALDDLGDAPLIVRSSSLLEDRLGTAFSGKYKSLFLANQGSKPERLEALMDAISEIYASVFSPDPIEYRREHGLLEFNEQMGILIQEVVGARIGKYYLPAFAGVAFSRNEFRWSPRIEREDGLIRLVPGLGTRAVDRTSDDYPILVVPGKPNLRVNVALDEVLRYSPKKIDVIDLERNSFETIDIDELLRECGQHYPALPLVFSVLGDGMLKKPVSLFVDAQENEMVATFEGLRTDSPFLKHVYNILNLLEGHLGTPVDIEFAHDGKDFYLLQCRPQSHTEDAAPAPIPKDISERDVLFSSKRYVSNGWVPDITHLVYVDPKGYSELATRAELLAVGRAVGQLNKLLPKKQFILMGPGRWGSRGDIKLGVNVTYADISNTAMLVEIARQSGNYVPDLSFGTHFFQDLVESRIRYLPLYPDDDGIVFNERYLLSSSNLLPTMLPEFAHLADTLRIIDIPASFDGRVLRVLMNADLDEALAILVAADAATAREPVARKGAMYQPAEFWRWRMKMAERIADDIDAERLGVVALYLFGSVKNATAGPGSDIDLLVHFRGGEDQQCQLRSWLDGWSKCLAEINYMRTGYRIDELLDVHLVTDQDIAKKTSYAVKIGAVTDAARELPLGRPATGKGS